MSADTSHEPWVFIVDDDRSLLAALKRLLSDNGYRVAAYASPHQFLDQHNPTLHGCLLLDLQMPELSGLEVQSKLAVLGQSRPVIFLSGIDRAGAAVSAIKGGAQDYLVKPVDAEVVLAAVKSAIEKDKTSRKTKAEILELMNLWRLLTNREEQVFWHVVNGRLNKQIAHDLHITERTVKVHRGRMMEKLKARSIAKLVRLAERIQPQYN